MTDADEPLPSDLGDCSLVWNVKDGAVWRSVICPGLRGCIPHFLKPLMMFTGVTDCGHASPRREAITPVVTTLPGLSAVYFPHAL